MTVTRRALATGFGLVSSLLIAAPPASAAAPPPAAAPAAKKSSGEVVSVRRDMVYVDLGHADGLRVGDTLTARGGARLEVVHVGERQLVARRVGEGAVRQGTPVTAPTREGGDAGLRPVVTLPAPEGAPGELPWAEAPARRAELIPTPGGERPGARPSPVRGEFIVSYAGILDQGENDLDIHKVELRSRLTVDDLLGGSVTYRHDVAGRAELGPNLDVRHGHDSRPYYRIRELMLRWRSPGWVTTGADSPAGAAEAAVGRIYLLDGVTSGLIDGARAELALGAGFSAGVHGGLVPRLLDTGFSADASAVGAHATWADLGDDLQARATLTTEASFWQGQLSRLDLGLTTGLSLGRLLDLYGVAVGTLVDDTLLPGGQPATSLSRGFVGVRVRPLWWLSVDAHYAHDRIVADREMVAALGTDMWQMTDPRETAWLQVRFAPDPALSVSLSGSYGFGYAAAELFGGAGRVTLRDLAVDGSRLALGYRFTQSQVVRAQVADIDVGVPIADLLDVGVGYAFSTFQSRLLDERQDEHRVSASVDLLAAGPWRVDVRGEVAFGDLPSQMILLAQLGWRFR